MRFSGSMYNFRIQGKIKLVPNCSTGLLGLLKVDKNSFVNFRFQTTLKMVESVLLKGA
jgi:hypothetical protein